MDKLAKAFQKGFQEEAGLEKEAQLFSGVGGAIQGGLADKDQSAVGRGLTGLGGGLLGEAAGGMLGAATIGGRPTVAKVLPFAIGGGLGGSYLGGKAYDAMDSKEAQAKEEPGMLEELMDTVQGGLPAYLQGKKDAVERKIPDEGQVRNEVDDLHDTLTGGLPGYAKGKARAVNRAMGNNESASQPNSDRMKSEKLQVDPNNMEVKTRVAQEVLPLKDWDVPEQNPKEFAKTLQPLHSQDRMDSIEVSYTYNGDGSLHSHTISADMDESGKINYAELAG